MNLLIVDDEIYIVRALCKNIDWKAIGSIKLLWLLMWKKPGSFSVVRK